MQANIPRIWLNGLIVALVVAAVFADVHLRRSETPHAVMTPTLPDAAQPVVPVSAPAETKREMDRISRMWPGSVTRSHLDLAAFGSTTLTFTDATRPSLTVPEGEAVRLAGWAVDFPNNKAAGGLEVQIDQGLRVSASTGIARPDVAMAFGNPQFANSGFEVALPPNVLRPGKHEISLLVISADRSGIYDIQDIVDIDVK